MRQPTAVAIARDRKMRVYALQMHLSVTHASVSARPMRVQAKKALLSGTHASVSAWKMRGHAARIPV
jgi:hypothetical protein